MPQPFACLQKASIQISVFLQCKFFGPITTYAAPGLNQLQVWSHEQEPEKPSLHSTPFPLHMTPSWTASTLSFCLCQGQHGEGIHELRLIVCMTSGLL